MAHPRNTIRDEIKAILTAAQTDLDTAAGEPVTIYNAKILTINEDKLPVVSIIYTEDQGGEEVDQQEQNPGDYNMEQRELIISIEVMTAKTIDKDAADQNDDLCQAVEDVIAKNITLNAKCENIELYRIRFRSLPEAKKPTRFVENLFRVQYKTIKAGA